MIGLKGLFASRHTQSIRTPLHTNWWLANKSTSRASPPMNSQVLTMQPHRRPSSDRPAQRKLPMVTVNSCLLNFSWPEGATYE